MSRPRISAEPLLAGGFVVMWSSGFIGAELAEGLAAPITLLAWRFIVMTAALAAWLTWRGRGLSPRDLALHAVIGALAQAGFLYGVFAAAANGVSSGTSALIAALQPIVATAAAAPLLGERVTTRQVVGLVLGLGGVALVVGADLGDGAHTPLWAFALPLAAMVSLVSGTLVERRARPRAGLPEALAVQCAISALQRAAVHRSGRGHRHARPSRRPDVLGGGDLGGDPVRRRRLRVLLGQRRPQRGGPRLGTALPHPAGDHGVGLGHVRRPCHDGLPGRAGGVRGGSGAGALGYRRGHDPPSTPGGHPTAAPARGQGE